VQPAILDGGDPAEVIGTLDRFQPLDFSNGVNIVDTAFVRLNDPNAVTANVLTLGEIVGITSPAIGQTVVKGGRTTAVTYGKIIGLNATVYVGYGAGTARFENQILLTHMSMPGDSGSVICTEDLQAVGLLSAGSDMVTVANPISDVFTALEVNLPSLMQEEAPSVLSETQSIYELEHYVDHFYTRSISEKDMVAAVHGWEYKGIPFYLFSSEQAGLVRINRYYHYRRGDHAYGMVPPHKSYQSEGGCIGYASITQLPGTVMLKEYYNARRKDHCCVPANVMFQSGQDGYTYTRDLGYVALE